MVWEEISEECCPPRHIKFSLAAFFLSSMFFFGLYWFFLNVENEELLYFFSVSKNIFELSPIPFKNSEPLF